MGYQAAVPPDRDIIGFETVEAPAVILPRPIFEVQDGGEKGRGNRTPSPQTGLNRDVESSEPGGPG